MNLHDAPSPEEKMVEKILQEGESQAKRLLDNARRTEAAELRKAEGEAEKVRAEILHQATAKAKALRSKEVASANVQAKRVLLRAREDAISGVFATLEQKLARLRDNPEEYRRALLALAIEAVSGVGASEVRLKIDEADRTLVDQTFVEQIAKGVADRTGGEATIKIETDAAVSGGGCVAMSADGRVVLDNSFGRRLERAKPELRSVIANEVLRVDG